MIAIDVETDGLNTRKNKVIGLGYYDEGRKGYLTDPVEIKKFCRALSISDAKILTWNGYFDLEMIRNNFQVDLWDKLYCDVQMLKHTVDEVPPFGLKAVGKAIFGIDAGKEEEELLASIKKNGGKKGQVWLGDPEIVGKYCIQDCKLTYDLFIHYDPILVEQGLTRFFYLDEVMPLYKEVTRFMQSKGVPVDVPLLYKLKNEIEPDINKLEDEIQKEIAPYLEDFNKWYNEKEYRPLSGEGVQIVIEMSGVNIPKLKSGKYSTAKRYLEQHKDNDLIQDILNKKCRNPDLIRAAMHDKRGGGHRFNLLSKHHLKKLFFSSLGERPVSVTKKGNPQVDDAFLELMANKYEWAAKLRDYNKLVKLKSTYIDRILELQEDGIYYPSYKQFGTISGRYSSDLQQLPRVEEEGRLNPTVLKYRNQIREIFVSGENHSFIDSDYESLEPHIFSHISNEDSIRDIFRKGHDFYSTIAIATEGLEELSADKKASNYLGKVDKARRQKAKAYSLGIPYGMESFALSKTLDIEQEDAERLIQKYLGAYPNLSKWMSDSEHSFFDKGAVRSEAGRVRHLNKEKQLADYHGKWILDSLELWKAYNADPEKYDDMKLIRRRVKNAINNSRNFQIQSLAASIVNRAMIEINRYMESMGIEGYVCAQIHDQIVVRVKEPDVIEMQTAVQHIMENNYKISVPLKAPAEIGKNFAEAH